MTSAIPDHHLFFVDALGIYQAPLRHGGTGTSRTRPSTGYEWKTFLSADAEGALVVVLQQSLSGPPTDLDQVLGSTIGGTITQIESAAPHLYQFRHHGRRGYAIDMPSMLAEQYPDHVSVVIGEDEFVVCTPGVGSLQDRRVVNGWGTLTLAPLRSLLPSQAEIAGAALRPLDGCLSTVRDGKRILVGVSATTDIQVLLAAAVFDFAATIFDIGKEANYVVTSWVPDARAIAGDLAVLSGRSVIVVDPATVVARGGVELVRQHHDDLLEPLGPQRLLRRTYADWLRLGERTHEWTNSSESESR
ncbi:hypothetical protein [Ferrimicrobium sp.]|uniref:hypothetical protein n=1 Tax=Ferrimicrobium sp. TaxID=2926050 RepID=UPI00261409AF|nr:hypothetical protein [Ferrimicrobium sp.]